MAMSEELQRRISNLTGDEAGLYNPEPQQSFMMASGQSDPYAGLELPDTEYLRNRQASGPAVFQNQDIKELLADYAGRIADGEPKLVQDAQSYIPILEQRTGLNRDDPQFQNMLQMAVNRETRTDTSIPEVVATGRMEDSPETIAQRAQDQELRAYQERARTAPSMAPMNPMRDQMEAVAPDMGTDQKLIELQKAINELQQQKSMTNDPEEIEALDNLIEAATTKALAPQAEIIDQLSQTGGEDNMMAHVRTGDINVSAEMLENNPQLEDAIERAALDKGIDPESMVYGSGVASLNVYTGAEEHGFMKKLGKSLKKVAKTVAPIVGPLANFIPGVGPLMSAAIAAGTTKLGGGSWKDALKSGVTSYGVGKLTSGIGSLGTGADAATAGAKTSGNLFSRMKSGIGSIFNPEEGAKGIFGGSLGPNIRRGIGSIFQPQAQMTPEAYEQLTPEQQAAYDASQPQFSGLFGKDSIADKLFNVDPNKGTGPLSFLTGPQQYDKDGNPIQSSFMTNTGGGLSGMGMLGIGALSAGLGKLAYEDTKKDKGVQLTPLNTMNATGRYNLEAEIARRMGQQAPNPTEFGLLPANTMPQLSGGQPRPEEQVMAAAMGGEVMNYQDGGAAQYPNKGLESLAKVAPEAVRAMGYNMGGQAMMPMNYNMGGQAMMPMNYNMGGQAMMPMAYAEGGNVAMEDFDRMNGRINGEGTETSDDIPAMLSDGEFVMTGQAVRGAGSYSMNNDGGILTLSPSGSPDREAGTDTMYQLMEAFSGQARPA